MNYLIKAYKLITMIVFLVFLISITALDSESLLPMFTLIGTGLWLTVYVAIDNNYELGDERR